MIDRTLPALREALVELLNAGLAAVDAHDAVLASATIDSKGVLTLTDRLSGQRAGAFELSGVRNVYVVGCGKAGAPMATAVESLLGPRVVTGTVTVKYGHGTDRSLRHVTLTEAGHPEPDENGRRGARAALAVLDRAGEGDLVVALISGGGSALWTLPAGALTLEEVVATTRVLLGSGAGIHEINAVRKHISLIKGGGAARAAAPARVAALVVSDVVGDELSSIASGPFIADSTTFGDAQRVIDKYGIGGDVPAGVIDHLGRGAAHESVRRKVSDGNAQHCICASNAIALRAIARAAERKGMRVMVVDEPVVGEARVAAEHYCGRLKRLRGDRGAGPLCVVSGGETTVSLGHHSGRGGRNQEFALACATCLEGLDGLAVLSAGTDGTDGPTDAAGAVVAGDTMARAHRAGLDPRRALDTHDAYPIFDALGDLIVTGPTGTNVMDVQVALVV